MTVQDHGPFVPADVAHADHAVTSAQLQDHNNQHRVHTRQSSQVSEDPSEAEAEILEPWADLLNNGEHLLASSSTL